MMCRHRRYNNNTLELKSAGHASSLNFHPFWMDARGRSLCTSVFFSFFLGKFMHGIKGAIERSCLHNISQLNLAPAMNNSVVIVLARIRAIFNCDEVEWNGVDGRPLSQSPCPVKAIETRLTFTDGVAYPVPSIRKGRYRFINVYNQTESHSLFLSSLFFELINYHRCRFVFQIESPFYVFNGKI